MPVSQGINRITALLRHRQIEELYAHLAQQGFCFAAGAVMREWLTQSHLDALSDWPVFAASWNDQADRIEEWLERLVVNLKREENEVR